MDPTTEQSSSPRTPPHLRCLIACPRSGSTLMTSIFAESPVCAVTSRSILMGNAGSDGTSKAGCSILENPSRHPDYIQAQQAHKQFLICKEEPANPTNTGKCLSGLLSAPSVYTATRPLFLIRDPVRVFGSWKSLGWTDMQPLIDYYSNIFRILNGTPAHAFSYILFENLAHDTHTEIKRVCDIWGVPFSESMLGFQSPFGQSRIFNSDRDRSVYCEARTRGIFTTLEASTSALPDVPSHELLSNREKDHLEEHIGREYIQCWQHEASRIRAAFLEKKWVGFDLDDTLHEFRRASAAAAGQVFAQISNLYGVSASALKDAYSEILLSKTANAFSDGKTSWDYRKERFSLLLERFSLPPSQHLDRLLDTYETTLTANLELKCGAKGLLSTIQNMGKKIVIVTEGPQDAQDRTIDALGIRDCVDFVATTNYFQVSKTHGLFTKVLRHLGISSGDIAYVGDNEKRDIEPAMAQGIFAVHFAETSNVSLRASPPRVNTLRKLQYILCGS